MSVNVSAKVWETTCRETSDKFVLLALADHANDEGVCYPSLPRVAERTGFAVRTVRTAVRRLSASGLLSVELNAGPRGCNLFTVLPEGDKPWQPLHPGSHCTPAANGALPRQPTVITPAAAAAEPSRTVKEPTRARQTARRAGATVEKAVKKADGDRESILLMWSEVIQRRGHVPTNALTLADVEWLLERDLVTVEQLREYGHWGAIA